MNHPKKLMIVAGGTGGHVFPGLEIARYLIKKNWQVRWLGTADRIEANLVPKNGIEIDFICISSLRGKGIKVLPVLIHIFNAWYQSRIIIQRFNPSVILGMGGYVSGPSVLAAWSLGIPIILHEQNSIPGLTNKWLSKIANKVVQGFPGAFSNTEVVGNPIRIDILKLPQPKIRLLGRKGPMRVLIIGGSQGASILNQIMPQVASKLGNTITVWHQSGRGAQFEVEQAYAYTFREHLYYKVDEFINDMAAAYSWADIIICRSGAMMVSEIAVVGLPALFVPFQHKDKQQYWNAVPLEKVGAAKILEQSQFTADAVVAIIMSWDRARLLEMAQYAQDVAIYDATERIAREISLIAKK